MPAASNASSVAVIPAKPRSTEWFDAVEQPSQPCSLRSATIWTGAPKIG